MKHLLTLLACSLITMFVSADVEDMLKNLGYVSAQTGTGYGVGYFIGRFARALQSEYPNLVLLGVGCGLQSGLIVPDGIDHIMPLQDNQRMQLKGRLAYYGGYFTGILYAIRADLTDD